MMRVSCQTCVWFVICTKSAHDTKARIDKTRRAPPPVDGTRRIELVANSLLANRNRNVDSAVVHFCPFESQLRLKGSRILQIPLEPEADSGAVLSTRTRPRGNAGNLSSEAGWLGEKFQPSVLYHYFTRH
jgi:hypothetical protein